jgi:MFS family permease
MELAPVVEPRHRTPMKARLAAIARSYVPPGRAGRTFMIVAIVDSIGAGLFLAGSVAFFVQIVGLSGEQVGLGLAIAGVAGLVATVPIGLLVDRIGAKRMAILLSIWRAAWSVVLAFVGGPLTFIIVAACVSIAERSVSPTNQVLVGSIMGDRDRVTTMAAVRSARNVGFSIGSLLTVPMLAIGSAWAFRSIIIGVGIAYVVGALLLAQLQIERPQAAVRRGNPLRDLRGLRDRPYLALTLLNAVFALHMTLLAVGLPLWTVANGVSTTVVPVLITINTVLAVLLQVPFSRGSERPEFGARAMRLCGYSLVASCLIMMAVPLTSSWVAIAALILGTLSVTAAELWQAVGSWELSFRYSVESHRAEYLSLFSLGTSAQNIVGPLVVTVVIGVGSVGWVFLAAGLGVALLLLPVTIRSLERGKQGRELGHSHVPVSA